MTTASMTHRSADSDAPLMLSVSGLRGIVGASFTPDLAARYAAAFGSYIRSTTGESSPRLCLGRDSRPTGELYAFAAKAGLAAVGCEVIDLGVVTTPTVAVMIEKHRAVGGLAITASHNPIEWNGMKALNADGVAPPPREAQEIVQRFERGELDYVGPDAVRATATDDSSHETHVRKVLSHIDPEPIRAQRFRVVLDSVNGAGCVPGRMLLDELGCDIIHLHGEPTGHFAHTPEPTEANLTELAQRTGAEGAAVGFAQDPDADRLAIIDERGRYLGEEYTLVLAARRVLEMNGPGVMAANLSTSRMIDDLAARFAGSEVVRTAVGEANVVTGLQPRGGIVGGEGNGGVIYPPVCWVRDSLSAMALVLSLMAAHHQPVSELVSDMPRYTMIKHKFELSAIGGREALPGMLAKVREHFKDESINDADGVRIDVTDGWVHLRPSNTEPIVRLIAEAKSDSRAWQLIDEVAVAAGLR